MYRYVDRMVTRNFRARLSGNSNAKETYPNDACWITPSPRSPGRKLERISDQRIQSDGSSVVKDKGIIEVFQVGKEPARAIRTRGNRWVPENL